MIRRLMRDLRQTPGNRRGALAAVAVLLTCAAMIAAPAHAAPDPGKSIKPHARPLDLPAFSLLADSGPAVTDASLAGRVTVLNIWATWCSPCLRELPSLDLLQQRLAGKVRVLAVSQDREGAAVAAPYLRRLGIRHLEALYDREATLTGAFRARVLPLTIILNKEGKELARFAGDLDWAAAPVVHLIEQFADR